MTWTATTCDNLKYALPVGGATLELASAAGTTDLCLLIGTPAARHVVLEVYTASGSETVVAYGCDGGAVQVTRANGGTTQLSWPVGACVRTVQIIEGALCGTEAPTDECCSVSTVWGGLTVCPELELDLSVPSAPRLCLKPSGVSAGDRCGGRLKVDTYGRITYMSADFPQACLPIFDPCACGGSDGPGTPSTADDITFTGGGGCLLTSGTVQQALLELEGYVCAINPSGGGVMSVQPGDGISITGGPSNPIVGLTSVVAAGTYGAFQVNAFGQIVGYSAPPASGLALGATAPLHVAQGVSGTYVFTIDAATETTPGVVQLASGGDLAADVPIPSDRVISWGFLQLWWDRVKNFICDLTNVVELTAAQRASAKIPMCVDGTTVSVSPAELVSGGGGAFARVRMDNGTILSSDNVTSVLPSTGPHGELVSMTNPAGANYHVYATNYVPLLLVPLITIVSPTQFYVAWYQVDSTATLGSAALQLAVATQWSAVVVRGAP